MKEKMKYKKGEQAYVLADCRQSKIRLTDGDGFTENVWMRVAPNTSECVLQNHALAFTPFESWGAIIPATNRFNFLDMLDKKELTLHPEAWQAYIDNNIIDDNGNYIKKQN